MDTIRWTARTWTGSAALIADGDGLVLHATEGSAEARVHLVDRDLLSLRRALDEHLGDDREADAW